VLVCHCHGLNDQEIRAAIRSGASSCRQVANQVGAGSQCGGCRPQVAKILDEEAAQPKPSALGLRRAAAR